MRTSVAMTREVVVVSPSVNLGAARPGMSGGPVLDETGRLAGLVFGVDTVTNDTLAIPASALRELPLSALDHPHC